MADELKLGTGWIPEEFDEEDKHLRHEDIAPLIQIQGALDFIDGIKELPKQTDLTEWAPPVEWQGGFNTCSAHVVSNLLEYFYKRGHGSSIQASRLFLYKVAKNYLQHEGDPGTYIRQVMGVLREIGAPPEKYWKYLDAGSYEKPNKDDCRIDAEPPAFCYAVAEGFEALHAYRLDRIKDPDCDRLLLRAKAHLAAELPFAFGIPLFPSLKEAKKTGDIQFPGADEKPIGNHAIVAMGYDDDYQIAISGTDEKTTGAFLIQNSWSEKWGQSGFGWVPYKYIDESLAKDFWTLIDAEWPNLGGTGLGVEDDEPRVSTA
jgi:C1A family cysteine protease